MNPDLEHALTQGPSTAGDLARITGLSKSAVHKALNSDERVNKKPAATGQGCACWIAPSVEDRPEATKVDPSTPSPTEPEIATPGRSSTNEGSKRPGGRKANHAGQQLYPVPSENPRRKGSHGHRSFQIILDRPGITSEQFVAAGGRLVDLRWDVRAGNVRAE